jgi:hypothetical protein
MQHVHKININKRDMTGLVVLSVGLKLGRAVFSCVFGLSLQGALYLHSLFFFFSSHKTCGKSLAVFQEKKKKKEYDGHATKPCHLGPGLPG